MGSFGEFDREKERMVFTHYMREDVQKHLFDLLENRELGPVFKAKMYGKRPQAVSYPTDIEMLTKQGVTSFHGSVELWKNPLKLSSEIRKPEMDELRTGWDMLFDIDCDKNLEIGKETAKLLMKALRAYGIKHYSIKFSGRRGWHIGISHKAFPDEIDFKPTRTLYPMLPQTIAGFLRHLIRDKLTERLLDMDPSLEDEMRTEGEQGLDPYKLVDVEQNWGPRHLFRMAYSFNEKTWLVSTPIDPDDIDSFKPDYARPGIVRARLGFLDKFREGEAEDLVLEAMDWKADMDAAEEIANLKEEKEKEAKSFGVPTQAIPEAFFPPCIVNILAGLRDGRKRSIFVLINFLRAAGWGWKEIEDRLKVWNEANPEPLRNVLISGQLTYSKRRDDSFPPPNCDYKGYYDDMKICTPDGFCKKIKNPAAYVGLRFKASQSAKQKSPKKAKSQKAKKSE